MSKYTEEREEQGFTLIELLIAIVVVGILTAVAIVGIAGLTDNGEDSACAATEDAAKAAQAVYYANTDALARRRPADGGLGVSSQRLGDATIERERGRRSQATWSAAPAGRYEWRGGSGAADPPVPVI